MVQRSRGAGFFREVSDSFGIAGEVRQQDLDRDVTIEPLVGRTPYFADRASPHQVPYDIGPDALPGPKAPAIGAHCTGKPLESRDLEILP